MPEIQHIFAQVAPCSDRNPAGRVTEAFYTVSGDSVSLCDVDGRELRDELGSPITAAVKDGQTARQIASRLALRRFRAVHGSDFDRPTSSLRFPRFVY